MQRQNLIVYWCLDLLQVAEKESVYRIRVKKRRLSHASCADELGGLEIAANMKHSKDLRNGSPVTAEYSVPFMTYSLYVNGFSHAIKTGLLPQSPCRMLSQISGPYCDFE